VLIGVGERVVQLGIPQAPLVMGGGQDEESGLAPGELEQRGTHDASIAHQARRPAS